MNYYKHHIGDYDSATAHLSMVEDAAYSRLMRLYYRTEKPIPADIGQACRLVRASLRIERVAVEAMLSEFFELRDDGWHQKRCDEEIDAAAEIVERNRRNGTHGGRPPKPKDNPNETQSVSKKNPDGSYARASTTPLATSHKPKEEEPSLRSGVPATDLVGQAFEAFRAVAAECGLPSPAKLTPDRRRHMAARLAEHGPEGWLRAMDKLAASSFCRGDGDRRWKADLDFVLQPKSFNRLIDGGYDNHGTPADDLLQQVRAGLSEPTNDQRNGHGNHQALHLDPDCENVGPAASPGDEHPGSGLDRDVLPGLGRPRPH